MQNILRILLLESLFAQKSREGPSGLRCEICRELAFRSVKLHKGMKKKFEPEDFLSKLQKRVCVQSVLTEVPNPKKYAMHLPTIKFECEDLVEKFGQDMVDALDLKEDMSEFCLTQDLCGEDDDF